MEAKREVMLMLALLKCRGRAWAAGGLVDRPLQVVPLNRAEKSSVKVISASGILSMPYALR
jgi:hypothetical protein